MNSKYRITLLKEQPAKRVFFDCDALSLEDAIAQAKAAYPDEHSILSGVAWLELPERYWAVTGYVSGDDEDTTIVIVARTREEAIAAFEEAMWKNDFFLSAHTDDLDDDRERVRKKYDTSVFINTITVSSSPIEVVASPDGA